MIPAHGDPFNPFGVSVPGDPMEEVLALQSYALAADDSAGDCFSITSIVYPVCNSTQSIVVQCNSTQSRIVIGPQPTGDIG